MAAGMEEHAHDEEESGEEEHDPGPATFFSDGRFTGETRLHGVDLRYTWAPTGNARNSELILQGGVFLANGKRHLRDGRGKQ